MALPKVVLSPSAAGLGFVRCWEQDSPGRDGGGQAGSSAGWRLGEDRPLGLCHAQCHPWSLILSGSVAKLMLTRPLVPGCDQFPLQ